MVNNNLPVVKKESIISKIKKWLNNLFGKNKIIINENLVSTQQIKQDDLNGQQNKFHLSIKFNIPEVQLLRQKIKSKEIKISELTDNQLDELIELYEKIIREKKEKLLNYRKLIAEV